MIGRIWASIKAAIESQFPCALSPHEWDWRRTTKDCIGVTLGWDARPQRYFAFAKHCAKCGWVERSKGYLPRDRQENPGLYNADGWPIDEAGSKLRIAE